MPPRNRSTGVKVWGRRTDLRHVHDQDRPELLFRCRKPATLNFTGRKWGPENGQRHGLNPCQMPLTPSLLVLLPSPQKKNELFLSQPREWKFKPKESDHVGENACDISVRSQGKGVRSSHCSGTYQTSGCSGTTRH